MSKYNNKFILVYEKIARKMTITIPKGIGRIGLNEFRDSFTNQRFNDAGSPAWKDVKRRDPKSNWYGFKLGNKARRPGVHTRKKLGKGNFSKARTTNAIMQVTGQLRDATFVKSANFREVVWANSSKQANLMNRGGRFRIFGKHSAVMPKRQFMGYSTRMMGKIRLFVRQEFKDIFK